MKCSITIPHQHIEVGPGEQGTLRGELNVDRFGGAHGHFALITRNDAHRYRALTGRVNTDEQGRLVSASIQVESIEREPGTEEITSIELIPLDRDGRDDTIAVRLTFETPPDDIPPLTCDATIDVGEGPDG